MSKLEQLRNNEALLDAITRGWRRALAEGRNPQNRVAASYIAARYRVHFDDANKLVNEFVSELEDLVDDWEIEQYLEDTNRWTTNHGYTP